MANRDAREVWRQMLLGASEEARRQGDRRLGTDHLLLGLLRDEQSSAAAATGISLADARAASEALDTAALAAIGVDVSSLGEEAPASFGRRLPPLTSTARAVLRRAADQARPRKRGRVDAGHFMLELLALERPDPAAELVDSLGIDRTAVRERLRGLLSGAGS
jgi:ATP-dependent Clp protease ATP-binding subunit ClpA